MSTFTLDTATSRATPSPVPGKRITVPAIRARKVGGTTADPIVMLTAYTMRMAQLLDPHCDLILVGDSLGQVIYGLPSTVPVTLEMMCNHGAAVVRGSWHSMVAVDMPFGSYEGSPEQAFTSAARIMKETGCAAVKLEGGEAIAPTIEFLSKRGIPVIGHVGLTPQAVWRARPQRSRSDPHPRRHEGGRRRGCLLHRHRGRFGGPRRRAHASRRHPHHRHRSIGPVRRAGARNRRHARHVRTHAKVRKAV